MKCDDNNNEENKMTFKKMKQKNISILYIVKLNCKSIHVEKMKDKFFT